jgi:hypothetical protein
LKIEGITSAASLRVVDLNYGSASGAARILHQTGRSPAGDPVEPEVDRVTGKRRVALESPPIRWLAPGGCQKSEVAGDFNLRRVVHANFNRAPPVPATAGYGSPAGYGIRMCGLHEYE